ncbi:sigma-70 family RNA polymerase sigma factor [Eubacterium sp. F2]|uniref:sigma-70 family RNA polymerase sigma factor n=1 Tax=Eubacterium sp. F2 TaxID=3381348 RepID=UPI0039083093
MAEIRHALREDPATIALLEDAGQYFKNYCQICVFERKLVRSEYIGKPLAFAFYGGDNSYNRRFPGDVSELEMQMEDRNILPKSDYVAVIESEVEFQITASVLKQLARDFMPVTGFENYMNFFSGQSSGFLLFLRVCKIDQHIKRKFWLQGSHGPYQIFDLRDASGSLCSIHTNVMEPVISDNQFSYLKDEVFHVLRMNDALISEYQNTDDGIKSLHERYLADKKLRNTQEMWHGSIDYNRYEFDPGDAEEDFDRAQLDYDAIFDEAESVCPAMKMMIENIRGIQAARFGEYDYYLELVHKRGTESQHAARRIFDMTLRSCVKVALYAHQNDGIEFEDAFQEACIGAWTAIWKHNDGVEGLFPSYASMWISQVMHRELPYLHQACHIPFHIYETISQILNQIKNRIGPIDINSLSGNKLSDLLVKYTDCPEEWITPFLYILLTPESIEKLQEQSDDNAFISDENLEENILTKIQSEELTGIALNVLTDRERTVIERRYGLLDNVEHTLEEVGQEMSVTRERIRQIESRAKRKIASTFYSKHIISREQFLSVVPKGNVGRKKKASRKKNM